MNSASRTTRILTILLLVAAIALSLPGTVLSQPTPPEVFVSPAAKVATTCATTTIAIGVKNVVGLTGYHLDITYDAADLEITNVVNGGFLGEPVNSEFYEPSNSWATPGVISFGMVQQNTAENPIQPRSGEGNLIVITLKAKSSQRLHRYHHQRHHQPAGELAGSAAHRVHRNEWAGDDRILRSDRVGSNRQHR